MKYPKMFVAAAATVVVLSLLPGRCLADDLNPPPWQRGVSGTTFAQWEFSVLDDVPPADIYYNPYGTPMMQIIPVEAWLPQWDGRQGVWPLSGTVLATIPNNPDPNPFKDIWIQLTWEANTTTPAPGGIPIVMENTGAGTPATLVSEISLGGNWYHSTYAIHMVPNPPSETIQINGLIMLDELVIDTICVPEPGTLSLLALGGAALFLRRRR
jgi:hypothetical protein